jgi:pyruvate-ferredoxin/flavodoxin oxidoreductase
MRRVCNDDALRPVTQTPDSIASLRDQWDLWEDLPNTPPRFIRIDDLDEGIGALETLLLDKDAYGALASGDGACLGCSEKTALHLFTATMEALMQPRVKRHVAYLDDLIVRLEQHLQQRLLAGVHVDDSAAMAEVLKDSQGSDLSLADLARRMSNGNSEPIDQGWLRRVSQLIADLKALRGRYTQGTTGRGRASMGMINATGCTSVWGSTYPFNPYPFPWTNHLFQDAPSIAIGVFEGHMAKMAQGFAAVRQAELELAGEYREREHGEFFLRFNWEQFSDEEWELCPPVVAVGGDGAMYDIGFQNLSRALMSGKPVKCWWSTRRCTRTPAARPARPGSSARSRTWRSTAPLSRASRKRARRSA